MTKKEKIERLIKVTEELLESAKKDVHYFEVESPCEHDTPMAKRARKELEEYTEELAKWKAKYEMYK